MKRVGIIGCGGITQTHAWALQQIEQVKLIALSDILPERASLYSEKYTNNEAAVYEDYKKMLAIEKPDVVHICTPHYLHVPVAIEALKLGIHVFCEKPPAISRSEFELLKQVAEKSEARLGFCFQNRYNETTRQLDALIEKRTLGKVTGARAFVTWKRDDDYYEVPWKGSIVQSGGGALINQSIHTLDLLLRYFKEPVLVKASMHNHHLSDSVEVEDTVEAWMEFEDHARACFYASTAYVTDAPVILEYQCEHGSITVMNQVITIRTENGEQNSILCQEPKGIGKSYWGSGHLSCIKDFYQALYFGKPYPNDWNGVKKTFDVTMQIYEEGQKGKNKYE